MPSARGIVIEIIGDATSYLRSADAVIASNTKLDESYKAVGVTAEQSAAAQVAAKSKVIEAQRAQVASLQAFAGKQVAGTKEAEAANLAYAESQAKLNRTLGVSTASTARFGSATKTGERDLGKLTRGTLAGSGAVAGLGRSLAFASGGFLAFAAGATLVSRSITGAENLEKAQRSLGVAIQHTGGNVQKLEPIYAATAKAAAQFGISEADATTGLARATALTGGAAKAQRAYQETLVISKATGKDFNSTLTATAKGQEGITTSLRRYGILIAKGETGTEQFTQVMQRFGGQAAANTTATQKLSASFSNAEATIGKVLLPEFNRLVSSLTAWLTKMQESGKLQKDVNSAVHDAGAVFHAFGDAVHYVDDVTGSFKNTLELILAIKFTSIVAGWVGALGKLAVAWGAVGTAAEGAGAAEAAGGAAGAAGAAGVAGGIPLAAAAIPVGAAAFIAVKKTQALDIGGKGGQITNVVNTPTGSIFNSGGQWYQEIEPGGHFIKISPLRAAEAGANPPRSVPSGGFDSPNRGGLTPVRAAAAARIARTTPVVFSAFTDTISNQLAQARAALTRSTADDVAAAKAEVAFIKKEIAAGHLKGQSLLQGLQAEASAVSTIQSAEAAAAQKRAAAAQALQAKIQAQIENSINPLSLQVELAREQASGKSTLRTLEKQRAAARKALRTENLTQQQQIEAYNEITSLNQQIADALKKQKKKIKDRANAFKELDLSKETGGLGLTRAQRKALEARLSQIGPGRTVPNTGTGAFGEVIGVSGRPIHIHTRVDIDGKKVAENTTRHQQKHRRRNSSQRRGPNAGITG